MADAFQVSYTIVSELIDGELHALAFWANGHLQQPPPYSPVKTPCERTLREGKYYCSGQVQERFPEDADLVAMGAHSYLGVALKDTQGNAIGDLCILHQQAISHPERAEQMLQTFAARAAAEVERQRAILDLEQLNQQLEAKVAERTATLQDREQFLQTVLDTFPLSVFWKDQNSVYLGCNRNFLNDAGLTTVTQIIGKTDYELPWGQTEAAAYRADDHRVISANQPKLGIIETQLSANGYQVWLETNKLPLHNLAGEVVGILGTYQNITARKRAEAALQNLIAGTAATTGQDFFPALVSHITEALGVSYAVVAEKVDTNLQILAFWTGGGLQSGLTYPLAHTPCEQVMQMGELYCEDAVSHEFPRDVCLVDLDVESYLGVALYDSKGEVIGSLCILDRQPIPAPQRAKEILRVFAARAAAELERQRANAALERLNQALETKVVARTAALQEREQFLQTVLDTFPLSVFWKDRNSVYLGGNRNFLNNAGLPSLAALQDKTDYDLPWSTNEAKAYRADDQQVIDSNRAQLGRIETQQTADGRLLWAETNKLPLHNLKGEVIGVLGTFQDITDRKVAEAAIKQQLAAI